MATIALSGIGSFFGGSILPQFGLGTFLGTQAGLLAGGALDRLLFGDIKNSTISGYRLSDLSVQTSTYGKTIPIIYGTVRIAGNIIWSTPIREERHEHQEVASRTKTGPKTITPYLIYSYYATFAIALCRGEIDKILRIWADDKLIDQSLLDHRIYLGSEEQEPDHLINAIEGEAPAYRGLSYIVIENFSLSEYGNRIPNFTFEIQRNLKLDLTKKVEAINIIPGSGEFVYDTEIQKKIPITNNIQSGAYTRINQNTHYNKSDALVGLDQLKSDLPNIEWVSVVVNWFTDSLHMDRCSIYPAVEFQGYDTNPSKWSVAGKTRKHARTISHDSNSRPIYGGTISDSSLQRYVKEMKSRGYKILLYPMLMVDTKDKPWRGRITGKPSEVSDFFAKYSVFINHYAELLNSDIDAFVIGSELKGITSISQEVFKAYDNPDEDEISLVYPGVIELVNLANKVKKTLKNVKITYAADWSEYHSVNGKYNMDDLWSCKNIDFIGIDAYFPLTDSMSPINGFSKQDIISGWDSGEGLDYFYKDGALGSEKNYFNDQTYAWKNIEYWWSNHHYDGLKKTSWVPKSKPIWFVEYGFPSVDCCSNQPNVFIDPTSIESKLPRYSTGSTDISSQLVAIEGTIDRWRDSEMIEKMFLWTWDARPFPYFPYLTEVWGDGGSWHTGHWVQGKISLCSLSGVITDILKMSGIFNVKTDGLNELINGYVVNERTTARKAIEILQSAYFFDLIEYNGELTIKPRSLNNVTEIKNQDISDLSISKEDRFYVPGKINISYINSSTNYQLCTSEAIRAENNDCSESYSFPLVLTESEGRRIAKIKLYEALASKINYVFTLPLKYVSLMPSDTLILNDDYGVLHTIKVLRVRCGSAIEINGISVNNEIYSMKSRGDELTYSINQLNFMGGTELEFLDLPIGKTNPSVTIAVNGIEKNWKGSSIYYSTDSGVHYKHIGDSYNNSTRGVVKNIFNPYSSCVFDDCNFLEVILSYGSLESVNKLSLYNGSNLALVGNELLQFQNAELIDNNMYRLSGFIRGRFGTEDSIEGHVALERFILIDDSLINFDLDFGLIGSSIAYKANSFSCEDSNEYIYIYNGNNIKPFSPVHLKIKEDKDGNLVAEWVYRSRLRSDWPDHIDISKDYDFIGYQVEIIVNDRTLRVLSCESTRVVYDIKKQKEDGLKSQSDILFKVYALSSSIGNGKACACIYQKK